MLATRRPPRTYEQLRGVSLFAGWTAPALASVDVPTVVGDPVIRPLGPSVTPAGRAPPASAKVYGGVVSPWTLICEK